MAARERVVRYKPGTFLKPLLQFMQLLSGMLAIPLAGTALLAALLIGPVFEWRARAAGAGLNQTQLDTINDTLLRGIETSFFIALVISAISILSMLATWLLFIIWARQKIANLPALGARNFRYRSILWMFWWFVPIVNFIVPLAMLWEVWRASDPSAMTGRRQEERSSLAVTAFWLSFLLSLGWFLTWLGFVAIYLFALKLPLPDWTTIVQSPRIMYFVAAVVTVSAMAAVISNFLGVQLVSALTQMQTDRSRLNSALQSQRRSV